MTANSEARVTNGGSYQGRRWFHIVLLTVGGTLVHSPFWDRLVEKEVLSNRSLNIAIWDVLGIIRRPRNGIFFPREILTLNNPYEPI